MLQRPHLWPGQFPSRVYVKRYPTAQGWNQAGPCVLWSDKPTELIVHVHNWQERGKTKTLRYDSAEAMIADGWVVD